MQTRVALRIRDWNQIHLAGVNRRPNLPPVLPQLTMLPRAAADRATVWGARGKSGGASDRLDMAVSEGGAVAAALAPATAIKWPAAVPRGGRHLATGRVQRPRSAPHGDHIPESAECLKIGQLSELFTHGA
jgi:hypothetical protein